MKKGLINSPKRSTVNQSNLTSDPDYLESQLVEHDDYGQVGHKIPVDIPKGAVFYRRVKNLKNSCDEFQEYTYQRNWGIIQPWDGLAKYYNCLD